jgi:hypothetical protein
MLSSVASRVVENKRRSTALTPGFLQCVDVAGAISGAASEHFASPIDGTAGPRAGASQHTKRDRNAGGIAPRLLRYRAQLRRAGFEALHRAHR